MISKIFTLIIVVIAIIVGILNVVPLRPDIIPLAIFTEFFGSALPILGFGALIKYLCCCRKSCCCCKNGSCSTK